MTDAANSSQGQPIGDLVLQAANADPRIRATARQALRDIDPEWPSHHETAAAVRLLNELLRAKLVGQQREGWAGEIDAVIDLLKEIGDQSYPGTLIRGLPLAFWRDKHPAINALGEVGGPGAVAALIGELSDPHWQVREHASKALAGIGGDYTFHALIAALERGELGAIEALAKLGDGRAGPHLLDFLAIVAADDPGSTGAASALATLGESRAASQILRCLNEVIGSSPPTLSEAEGLLAESYVASLVRLVTGHSESVDLDSLLVCASIPDQRRMREVTHSEGMPYQIVERLECGLLRQAALAAVRARGQTHE